MALRVGVIVPAFPAADDAWFMPPVAETQVELSAYVNIHVFTLSYPLPNAGYQWRGVAVQSFGAYKKGSWLLACLVALRREHRRQPFDLLHAYWATEPGLVGVLAKHKLKLPLLITSLGGECVGLRHLRYGAQLKWRWRQLVPYILRQADCIVCGSTAQSEWVERIGGIPKTKCVFLPLGAKLDLPPPRRGINENLRLLAVSAFVPVKNVEMILQALTYLPPNVMLEIVGDGPLRPHVEARARTLGLAGRVTFRGWIAHEKLMEIYERADVFVHASWHEGEGFVIEEALAAGLPVVSSKVGIAGDVVIPGKNGHLFAPGDEAALTAALRRFVERPRDCRCFGAASRAIAEEKLDRSRQVQKLFSLYQGIVAKQHGHSLQS